MTNTLFKILDKRMMAPDPRFYNRCLGKITRGNIKIKKNKPERSSVVDLSVSLELVNNFDLKCTAQRSVTEHKQENDNNSYTEIKATSKGGIFESRALPSSKYVTQKSPSNMKNKFDNKGKEQICVICYDHNSDSVLLPCCHGGLCFDCAIQVSKQKAVCHFCRKVFPTEYYYRTFGRLLRLNQSLRRTPMMYFMWLECTTSRNTLFFLSV